MYERTEPGLGWKSPTGQFMGEPRLLQFGSNNYLAPDRAFLNIAVDSASGTAVVAREFRRDQLEVGLTQGCRVCDMSATGDCTIIPLE